MIPRTIGNRRGREGGTGGTASLLLSLFFFLTLTHSHTCTRYFGSVGDEHTEDGRLQKFTRHGAPTTRHPGAILPLPPHKTRATKNGYTYSEESAVQR